ncbi:sugar phosphate isomerase/epimerase family protein [Herbiconiux daphne]|uniref:Sugar phosphate isomerase/epimerase n=1 Tax=Herbiconiux daphne TaxID=2970914 RepID=A0ABT2H5E1_9MICO|nr:sugar phosphate isomerase/epimerase family protein [Herbiconiux daphne]MCS5735175.1 sugar phosphate isomerase/epimerase [Herbiconiux daphne]
MTGRDIPLLATCWTSAGDAAPQVGDERSPIDLRRRIETAAASGWSGFGLVHADLIAFRETRGGLAELDAILRDNGMGFVELEFLGEWWTEGERRAASDLIRRDLFDAAEALGARTVKVAAAMEDQAIDDPDVFARELDALASEAVEHGTRVALEPMPFSSNLRTVQEGAALLDAIGNPGAGLCIDIWHVYRTQTDYSVVAGLPRDYVFVVELDDGAAQPTGSLWSDTIDRRRYPGRGDFDVPAFARAVRATGFDGPWGVEIISAEHRARPIEESLPELAREVRACFDQADAPGHP